MRLIHLVPIAILFSCQPTEETKPTLYLGADLSYVNEMLDCGGEYHDSAGQVVDPYELFAAEGCNLVRLRLWHDPDWTAFSTFEDVKKAIRRSKAEGMRTLLDFHYSDDWADPGKQVVPAAWKEVANWRVLGDSLYQYTYGTLEKLAQEDLLPDMVQVGNEINSEICMPLSADNYDSIHWQRNVHLLNRGLQAVEDAARDFDRPIERMIHIAQPENAEWWFPQAFENGLGDFEWIALSYYPKWSKYKLDEVSVALSKLRDNHSRRIMVVETAYPHGFQNVDSANNIMGPDAVIEGYPATPAGQKDFMIALTDAVIKGGGEGVIYWEPAWISTPCSTRWGVGSHWDNVTFFDAHDDNRALQAFDFFDPSLYSR